MDISTFLLIISISTLSCVLGRPQSAQDCREPADIVFILDSSTSIWRKHFKQQTAFVSEVIDKFDIGPGPRQTRVGVLTFGHEVWMKFGLKDFMDKQTMIETVKGIEHGIGMMTKTADAIKFAVTKMFTNEAGHRPGIPRIAIVITDGRSQNTSATSIAAQKAHDYGINVFAIGVGLKLDFNELKEIASDPDSSHMFHVEEFEGLSTITETLAKRTCDATKTPVPTTTPLPTTTTTATTTTENSPSDQSQKDCGGKPAEVMFVVDSSGSITRKDFLKEIDFVRNVIKMFDINNNITRVGLISFSNDADVVVGLNNNLSKELLIDTISNITHVQGGTNTAEALSLLRRSGFANNVVRKNVPKIAIFLTDGLSADEDRTIEEARLTHRAGIKVFAIGIGHGVDLIEIKRIASNPDDDFVFQVDDFNSLDSIKELLAVKTCALTPDRVKDEPVTEPACEIKQNTDLMFIYDITALGEERTRAISAFLTGVLSQIDLMSGHLHVGRITDNCPSGGNFQLSDRITSADFSSIRLSTFSRLIKKVVRSGFNSEYGARKGSNKVGVLFIDASMDSLDSKSVREAEDLSKNAEVFVIAMGHNHIIHEFSKAHDTNHFIHLDSYRELDGATDEFLGQLCSAFNGQGDKSSEYDIAPFVPV